MSTSDKEFKSNLRRLRILYVRMVWPVDVSFWGERGTLKSPPKIIHPSANHFSSSMILRQNGMWVEFGKYTLANVTCDPAQSLLRKR